jgi:hypothetical protein
MKINILLGILIVILIGCSNNKNRNTKIETDSDITKSLADTSVYSYGITDLVAGSAIRKRAIGYLVVVDKDTSDFQCIFTELKDGKVNCQMQIPYYKKSTTHSERLKELKFILGKASEDFNFDSLKYLSLGRLVLSGDLAIGITNEYIKRFGTNRKLMDYKTMKQFFIGSQLGVDLNNVLRPYSIKVMDVSLEKLFFTSKEDLYWASKIEIDSTLVPERIIDCITSVELKRE